MEIEAIGVWSVMLAMRRALAANAKTVPSRRCDRSVSEASEAIFDCTGGEL